MASAVEQAAPDLDQTAPDLALSHTQEHFFIRDLGFSIEGLVAFDDSPNVPEVESSPMPNRRMLPGCPQPPESATGKALLAHQQHPSQSVGPFQAQDAELSGFTHFGQHGLIGTRVMPSTPDSTATSSQPSASSRAGHRSGALASAATHDQHAQAWGQQWEQPLAQPSRPAGLAMLDAGHIKQTNLAAPGPLLEAEEALRPVPALLWHHLGLMDQVRSMGPSLPTNTIEAFCILEQRLRC